MEEIVKNLSGIWYLATSENDQPHVRAFDKAAVINDKLYIGTAKNKKVFQQIAANPKVEIYALTDFGPCRFMAEAYATDDTVSEEAFLKMGKIYDPATSVALELRNIQKY